MGAQQGKVKAYTDLEKKTKASCYNYFVKVIIIVPMDL